MRIGVDSADSSAAALLDDGMVPTDDVAAADLVVVNTCAFIEEARQESIDTILALDDERDDDARLVVTGCMAERYGDELAEALPEVFGKRSSEMGGLARALERKNRNCKLRSQHPWAA